MKVAQRLIFSVAVLLLIFSSCKKEENPIPKTLDDVIEQGGQFADVRVNEETVGPPTIEESVNGDDLWTCTKTRYSVEDATGGGLGFPLFNPNGTVIFPGSLIQGKSLRNGTPDGIFVDRSGGTISIDIYGTKTAVEVDKVDLGTIAVATNEIISGLDGTIPAEFNFKKEIIQSEEELAIKIRADYEGAFTEMNGALDFNYDKQYSRMFVRLDQIYYNLRFTQPTSLDGFFAPSVTPDDLVRYVGSNNPPAYISQVSYGRIFYMLIESTATESDLELAVNGSFEGLTSSGSGSLDLERLKKDESIRISIFAYGGETIATLKATELGPGNIDELTEILQQGTDVRAAKPISYVANSVYDHKIVAMQLATEYDKTTCTITSNLPPPALTSDWGKAAELLGGPIGSVANLTSNNVFASRTIAFFDKEGLNYVLEKTNGFSGPFSVKVDLGGGGFPLADVGAAGRWISGGGITGTKYSGTYIFNKKGDTWTVLDDDGRGFSTPQSIGIFSSGSCPFNGEGVSGIAHYGSNNVPNGTMVISKDGSRWATFNEYERKWYSPKEIYRWGTDGSIPFDRIGAVVQVDVGLEQYTVFFNLEGTQYCVFHYESYEVKGPFKL